MQDGLLKRAGEIRARLGIDPQAQTSVNETAEERALDDRELKTASKKYAQDNFQGKKFINMDTGREINVTKKGLNKWDSITKSRDQGLSIKKLNELLERGKKVGSEKDKKGRKTVDGYTYFESPIDVNNTSYTANLATRETHGKDSSYYYHFLRDLKNKPDPASSHPQYCDEASRCLSGSDLNLPQSSPKVKGNNNDKEQEK